MNPTRIGIVGYGYIGSYIYKEIVEKPELGLEVAFVYNRNRDKLADLPQEQVLADLAASAETGADLIVELAHPDITRQYGAHFLQTTDYMPLSLTALADAQLQQELLDTAEARGTSLFVPHGAVIGLDALVEGRQLWEEVKITMKKPVRSVDFSAADVDPQTITGETVLFDGSARQICPLYPRNVNSHAAVALAGLGFDRTRSILVADPELNDSIIELEASGGGIQIQISRTNPMQGVSGVFTLISTLASIRRAKAERSGLQVC